ncbi:MATH domain-containing protein [Ditylenchus destructor]|nr:MATH domain-containing protein [Ditylenchus destructor]
MKTMIDSESDIETVVPEWKPKRQILTASGDDDNGFYKSEGSIELRIERFEEFVRDEQERWSVPVYILGWRWEIEAYSSQAYSLNNRNEQSPFKDLEVYLCCNRGCASETWLCEAKYALRIMPQTDGVKDIIFQDTDDFSNKRGHSEFANCDVSYENYDKLKFK